MEIYQLKKQKLPMEVLVYKEIGKRVVSGKQYKYLRKHALIVRRIRGWSTGTWYQRDYNYNRGNPSIHIKTESVKELLSEGNIDTFIHELGHMADYHRRNRKHGAKAHNGTFHKKLERLRKNYEQNVKPELERIKKDCQRVANGFSETKSKNEKAKLDTGTHNRSIDGKLEKTLAGIKRWTTKQRRAETALKKLNRRKKLYERLLAKSQ